MKIANGVFSLLFFAGAASSDGIPRVVPMAPAIAEWYCDVSPKCEDEIVGVTEYTNVPSFLKKKPTLGPYHQIHIETLLALKPTWVLATTDGNSKVQVEQIQKLKIRTHVFETKSLADVSLAYQKLGELVGQTERAKQKIQAFEQGIQKLKTTYSRTQKRAALVLGTNPLVVAGGRGYLAESLAAIGINNVYGDLVDAYPHVSRESLITRKPDVIIVLGLGSGLEEAKKMGASLPSGNKVFLTSDKLARPGLRLVEGLQELATQVWQ